MGTNYALSSPLVWVYITLFLQAALFCIILTPFAHPAPRFLNSSCSVSSPQAFCQQIEWIPFSHHPASCPNSSPKVPAQHPYLQLRSVPLPVSFHIVLIPIVSLFPSNRPTWVQLQCRCLGLDNLNTNSSCKESPFQLLWGLSGMERVSQELIWQVLVS